MILVMEMVNLSEFWITRKERKEHISTIVVVAGVKLCVVLYDLCARSSHEMLVSVQAFDEQQNMVLRIPEIQITRCIDMTTIIEQHIASIL